MPREKVERAWEIYRERGAVDLSYAAHRHIARHVIRQQAVALNPLAETTTHGLYALADELTLVQDEGEKTVTYDGQFRKSLPEHFRRVEGTIKTPERVVAEYRNAKLLGEQFLLDIGGRYTVPMAFTAPAQRDFYYRLGDRLGVLPTLQHRLRPTSPTRDVDTGFLLLGVRGNFFGHWFDEVLVKLRWYERYCDLTGERPPLIVPTDLDEWQLASLSLMGYSEDDLLEHGEDITRVERLLVPPHPLRTQGGEFLTAPENLQWVRERIASNLPPSNDRSFPKRVYISRADWVRRNVVNEDELMKTLDDMDFEKVHPARLPFEDQVRLFAGAEVVIGPHCSALKNLIHSWDASVVELLNPDGVSAHFLVLANELGLSYEYLACEPADTGHVKARHKDLIVHPGELGRLLREDVL